MSFESVDRAIGVPNIVPRALIGVATGGTSELLKLGADEMAAPAREARAAARKLEEQRRAQLAREAADREAARKRAETAGQRVGLSSRTALLQAGGAGSGDTQFGPGAGTLFGN